jgi:hypothetical protein
MNLREQLKSWMEQRRVISVYVIGENEGYILGRITRIEDDFVEIQMREGMKIVPLGRIGYITLKSE